MSLLYTHLIVHHTGAEERDAAQVRRYHLSLGWREVGYNFIIQRNGLVVPGRPLGVPGAHCRAGGMNTRGIGIALIGNLNGRLPTASQWEALVELLGVLGRQHRIPAARILGHREVPGVQTACPGERLAMERLRNRVDIEQVFD